MLNISVKECYIVLLLTEIGFFKCQVQNLRAIEEGGLWYVKSVRLDISVGRSSPALVHPPSQPNQPSPQASLCQTASALNGPKLGRFSRQPGRFRQPVEKFLHVVQNLNPSNSSQNHHRQEQKKKD